MSRKSRTSFIKRFINGGGDVCIVPLEEQEDPRCVYTSMFYAIRRNPYWNTRIEVFTRRGRVYLARKE